MPSYSASTIEIAKRLRERFAGNAFPYSLARLYSQHTKLRANLAGLPSWRSSEAITRLEEAVRLIEAGFIEKESGAPEWRDSLKRAAEILEWLDHPSSNPRRLPLPLYSAAAYQLAGYSARASAIIRDFGSDADGLHILQCFIASDFNSVMPELVAFWATNQSSERDPALPQHSRPGEDRQLRDRGSEEDSATDDGEEFVQSIGNSIRDESIRALGVIAGFLRWGENSRYEVALGKLEAAARLSIYSSDGYSWILAKLVYESAREFLSKSLRAKVSVLIENSTDDGRLVFERYVRKCFLANRSLIWPSQELGIQRLAERQSFALCTPTGSGKTTIAELAILQNLFLSAEAGGVAAPIAMYLVPLKALATEVEAGLSRALKDRSLSNKVTVTGLYGGTDWGPTDVWLTSDRPTVLIATYEKGEALLRYLGSAFINRLSLVIVDEAHSIQFNGDAVELQAGTNRSLRLESLITRILSHVDTARLRTIALSAVASGIETNIARWVVGSDSSTSANTHYRSTRQLVGRLECRASRAADIYYDSLDGASLTVETAAERPYILNAVRAYPVENTGRFGGAETQIRPYLFWAALTLATPDDQGRPQTVLMSIPQHIGPFAEDLLRLVQNDWADSLPPYFSIPVDPHKLSIYQQCLQCCEDYFSTKSVEYKLLQRGVVVHHGKMPPMLSRRLVELVREKIVTVVMATSTLSEGVNLPFETVLIPSLKRRRDSFMDLREFSNLIGRAGRPGTSTEGRTLVLLQEGANSRERRAYNGLVSQLQSASERSALDTTGTSSALAKLLELIESSWREISATASTEEFLAWLETTTLEPQEINRLTPSERKAKESLDSLDQVLLSSIVEAEALAEASGESNVDVEEKLSQIWRRSYAWFSDDRRNDLESIFLARGSAVNSVIYPDARERVKLYRSSLPPRHGKTLLAALPSLKALFMSGAGYAGWPDEDKFAYIESILTRVNEIPIFEFGKQVSTAITWNDVLKWWLVRPEESRWPDSKKISKMHNFVSSNFMYKANWAIGSVISLIFEDEYGENLADPSFERWAQIGLPWICLWIKELVTWGTLEPLTAHLMASGTTNTRAAANYYKEMYLEEFGALVDKNELISPMRIRAWAEKLDRRSSAADLPLGRRIAYVPNYQSNGCEFSRLRVLPVVQDGTIRWFDVAGYLMGTSVLPASWETDSPDVRYQDYSMNTKANLVTVTNYV